MLVSTLHMLSTWSRWPDHHLLELESVRENFGKDAIRFYYLASQLFVLQATLDEFLQANLAIPVRVKKIEEIFNSLSCLSLVETRVHAMLQTQWCATLFSPSMVMAVPNTSSISLADMVPKLSLL